MKFWTKAAIAAGISLAGAQAASAQVVLEAAGARADGLWGAELGIGYQIGAAGFALTPAVGAFLYRGDNDRYVMDEFDNGQSRCRDMTNGQFADDALCSNVAVKPYGRLEATYSFPVVEVGAGVRISTDKARPYGTAAFTLAPLVKLKGNIGDGYYAVGVRAGF